MYRTQQKQYLIEEPFRFGMCPVCGAIGVTQYTCARSHHYPAPSRKLLSQIQQEVFEVTPDESQQLISFLNACGSNAYKYDKKMTALDLDRLALTIAGFPLIIELAKMHLKRIRSSDFEKE